MAEFHYVGSELETFAHARNWKAYLRRMLAPYLTGDILEVGAGIGATMKALRGSEKSWTCLEPDPSLADALRQQVRAEGMPVTVLTGTVANLPAASQWDTVLYVDVLEHIEDDRSELVRAAGQLRPDGRIVVLSPAHEFLYSPFDARIGHFRRYSRRTLVPMTPPGMTLERLIYLDALGMILSAANRMLLRSEMPSLRQVLTWDRWFVPVSKRLDPLLGRRVGKSVLAVWRHRSAVAI